MNSKNWSYTRDLLYKGKRIEFYRLFKHLEDNGHIPVKVNGIGYIFCEEINNELYIGFTENNKIKFG